MADAYAEPVQAHEPPIFILVPLNSAARKATEHPRNKYYQYEIDENTLGLWIGFADPEKQAYTLGRGRDADIYLPDQRSSKGSPHISDLQASFQLVQETGAVLLCDHSDSNNTEPFAPSSGGSGAVSVTVKFRSSNSRSVLVARGINPRVAFGRDKFYQFELLWQNVGLYSFDKNEPYTLGPKKSSAKKYVEGERVGGGAYGAVWWVLDITNGSLMAVKKFHNLSGKNLEFATREVANLFRINKNKAIHHDHILQIYDYAGGEKNDNWGEIFMPLMSGNLKTLVERSDAEHTGVADTVLRQMLLALQCIASHRIVHRDIKPENILWNQDADGGYHFCLGDFGLSNDPKLAITVAGTEPFMAPEVYHRQPQTTKVDIWSLFATYVWVNNTNGFRNTCTQYSAPQIHSWLNKMSTLPEYASISRMASMNPKKRPSAEQQLAILDGGLEYEDYPDVGSFPGPEAQFPEELSSRFGNITLEDSGYGQDSGDSGATPEMPYYEPYTSGLMESYPWEEGDQAGPSKRYQPPGSGEAPRDPHQAYVAPYDNPYGTPAQDDDGSGTVIPDTGMWTARQLTTEEEPQVYREREPKRKGKEKYRR